MTVKPLPGQIVVDPRHPQWLMRHEGGHVFICGPGDPEDFLYVGRRNSDGTRDGDQVARIEKLVQHGGNCIYIQLVRTHGGDARPDATQNPFVDSDPAKGLDDDILRQWDDWFARLDRHNILIYLFFYDDSARIWNTGDQVGPEERAFVETIVQRYKHLKNLIWVIGEESEERYSTARVQALAQIIKDNDDHGHLIGDHHQSGTTFKAWQEGGALNHFAMQLGATDNEAHAGAIEALRKADGRYQIIYSESTAMRTDVDGMRSHAWAVAMGGLMPMLLRMDIATTSPEALQQCRHLQTFFEAADFWTLAPHDELKHAQSKYVLANPGRSYIVYGDTIESALGLKEISAGPYAVHWLDCRTGKTADATQRISAAGDATFARPAGFGPACAAWIRRTTSPALRERGAADSSPVPALYPDPDWPTTGNWELVETRSEQLTAYNDWLSQRCGDSWAAVVIKRGYLVFEGRGPRCHIHQPNDCGSIKKSLQGTVLGVALQQGRLASLDENALPYWKEPFVTKYENDRRITFREFATYRDRWNDPAPPGKFRYNNSGATAAGACIAGLFQDVRGRRPKGIAEIARREVAESIGANWNLWYWEQDFTDTLSNPGPRLALEASVYELAKFGYLWLRRGKWKEETIFSETFYREAVTDWSPDTGSTANGFVGHYGYWWFVNTGQALLPDVPPDAFYHIGNGHPKRATGLLIIPSLDTVAVLSMERLSDDGKWDVIQNSRALSNDGMRQWSAQVVRLHGR
jgi:CubicO group peptidase (beta-lactamase class C family)